MTGHQHAHEFSSLPAGFPARHDDLIDLFGIEVADRSLDQIAFLVDEAGRRRGQRQLAHALPQTQEIFVVALDFLLGAGGAGRANDEPHAFRHVEFLGNRLEPLAILRLRDLARNAAAAPGVGHEHGIAARE